MTDRISSAMIPQSALASISLAQQQLVEAARQSSSQTKAVDMKGYGRETQTLVSAQRLAARTQGFLSTSNELKTRMSLQDVALGRAADQIAKLKGDLFQNVGLDSGDGVRSQLEETFAVLKDAMNTNLGGRYLFGGVQNDQPPVTATTLSNLAANPLTSSIVQGAPAQTERVEAGRSVAAGPVADDVITAAMASIQRLTQVDEGVDGPFGGQLTANQKTAIQNELSALTDAFNGLLGAQAENGRLSKDVESAANRQQSNLDSLNGAVGGIVNVDLASVAVKLNQAQFAYQASSSVFATIKGLSLLTYLPPG